MSVDALGNADVAANSVRCLRKQGRHVQAGLLSARATALPMATVIAKELEVLGTKGMSARQYPALMDLIASDRHRPQPAGAAVRSALDELPGGVRPPWRDSGVPAWRS